MKMPTVEPLRSKRSFGCLGRSYKWKESYKLTLDGLRKLHQGSSEIPRTVVRGLTVADAGQGVSDG